ncbi:MAG: hypothetical protein R2883_05575 [Caldisericia bacterium]
MKKISLVLVCLIVFSSFAGCGETQKQIELAETKEIYVEAIGSNPVEKPIQRETLKTASDGVLTGSWKGINDECTPGSTFISGRKWFQGLDVDSQGRAHLKYTVSGKLHGEDNLGYIIKGDGQWLTLDNKLIDPGYCEYGTLLDDAGLEFQLPERFWVDSKKRTHFFDGKLYLVWNGENWQKLDGEVINPTRYPEITFANPVDKEVDTTMAFEMLLDSKDCPHVVFYDHTGYGSGSHTSYLFYIRWDGKNWVTIDGEIYDVELNNGQIYEGKNVNVFEGDMIIFLDNSENLCLFWEEEDYSDELFIKGMRYIDGEWVFFGDMTGDDEKNSSHGFKNIFYFIGKENVDKWSRQMVRFDAEDNLHYVWNKKEGWNNETVSCYAVNKDGDWYNKDDEKILSDWSNAELPVTVEHIDEHCHLHNIDIVGENFDLLHTMWDGKKWMRIDGVEVPPEGDESCIFFKNYYPRIPEFFDIKTQGNNFYITWRQISEHTMGIEADLNFMEWIEDGSKKVEKISKDDYEAFDYKLYKVNLDSVPKCGEIWKPEKFNGKGELEQKWENELGSGGFYKYEVLKQHEAYPKSWGWLDPKTGKYINTFHTAMEKDPEKVKDGCVHKSYLNFGFTDKKYKFQLLETGTWGSGIPLYAYAVRDYETGKLLWEKDTDWTPELYVVDGALIRCKGGQISRLNPETGEFVWILKDVKNNPIGIQVYKEKLVFGAENKDEIKTILYFIDPKNGEYEEKEIPITGMRSFFIVGSKIWFFDDKSRYAEYDIEIDIFTSGNFDIDGRFRIESTWYEENEIQFTDGYFLLRRVDYDDYDNRNYVLFDIDIKQMKPLKCDHAEIINGTLIVNNEGMIKGINPETLEAVWWIKDTDDNLSVDWCDSRGVLARSYEKLICFGRN